MAILSWGKPVLCIRKIGGSTSDKWIKLPTPVDGSTLLTPTKGQKVEAKVEGGENEDVRYGKNTYALEWEIRAAKGRKKPVADSDGIIEGNYELALQPEDPEAVGIKIDKGTLSVEDTWSSADGGKWKYTLDALKPDEGDQVKNGKVVVTEESGETNVTFTEDKESE